MRRVGLTAGALLSAVGSLALAQNAPPETTVRTLPLKCLSAVRAAAALRKPQPLSYEELARGRQSFLERAFAEATTGVRPPRNVPTGAVVPLAPRNFAEARVAQTGGGGELAQLMPEGVKVTPVAVPEQNALMVRGTVKDIDAVAELLQLIDVPPQQVNVAVKLLNVAGGWSEESGGDVAGAFPGFDLAARGQAPATGPTMRFGSGGAQALVGGSRTQSLADNSVEASVTTINNTPCVIRAATLIPYVTANVTYNRAGQRQVDYAVDAVATGVELVVLPRITGQDTVTMLLRPSFIDAVGRALTPDGQALPITQETAVETQIRVRDGETVVIGGLPRHTETLQSLGLSVLPLRAESLADVESLVLVRPRILRSPPR